ncbi:MAG: hypothetical protein QNJ51_01535 [Calothrix sp. MO_167.B12]|nr:hypothetical protein [Calothrix sp. MO_167.B12]
MRQFQEAEIIRDSLLQESFTIRRYLEILSRDHADIPQEYFVTINNWHQSLAKLSDRLFPECLPDHLPLAIEFLLEKWLESYPNLEFDILLPTNWRVEAADCSLVILTALDELLRITMSQPSEPTSIYIRLKLKQNIGMLIVRFYYSNVPLLVCHSRLTEVSYLSKSFKFLTSGKCIFQMKQQSMSYLFSW